jgi:hypothetical protein
MFYHLLLLFNLLSYILAGTDPVKIIEISTWDPSTDDQSKFGLGPADTNERYLESIRSSFANGKRLRESSLANFFGNIVEDDYLFLSPNYISAYGNAYAKFQGFISEKTGKKAEEVVEKVKSLKTREVSVG